MKSHLSILRVPPPGCFRTLPYTKTRANVIVHKLARILLKRLLSHQNTLMLMLKLKIDVAIVSVKNESNKYPMFQINTASDSLCLCIYIHMCIFIYIYLFLSKVMYYTLYIIVQSLYVACYISYMRVSTGVTFRNPWAKGFQGSWVWNPPTKKANMCALLHLLAPFGFL